jgi:dTDP-4-dehydrorhamnose 3,5-epimerase-like enzyme
MDSELIQGNIHTDSRGTVSFINEFDMNKVIRMYSITPEISVVRAWQGHQIETKWFYVAKGSFIIKVISIENPSLISEYTMSEINSQVLHIPGGHYNGFEATEKGSVLMVFSDTDLQASIADDIRQTLEVLPWIR